MPAKGSPRTATVIVSVRPEDVELSEAPPAPAEGDNVMPGHRRTPRISSATIWIFSVKVGDVVLLARAHPSLRTPTGDPIYRAHEGGQMRRHSRTEQ